MHATTEIVRSGIELAHVRHRPACGPLARAVYTLLGAFLLCALDPAAPASAQENPLSTHNRMMYGGLTNLILRTAEKMPEESFAFRPTPEVRTFGQIVGHIADTQFSSCSLVLGESDPAPKVEQTRTTKAEIMASLKDAIAFCGRAYGGMTDASATQLVNFFGRETPRFGVLNVNTAHSSAHYGNLITYLRLKNIVPPLSESRPAQTQG